MAKYNLVHETSELVYSFFHGRFLQYKGRERLTESLQLHYLALLPERSVTSW